MTVPLRRLSQSVARLLEEKHLLLVLAESCTAGLVAASLGGIPGISRHLCGSAVTYQEATKHHWLEIAEEVLAGNGAVSKTTAALMAEQVLRKTPQAHLSAAITGHLGPNAPAKLDGVVFVAVSRRTDHGTQFKTKIYRFRLEPKSRVVRQRLAAQRMLTMIQQHLESVRP